LQPEVAHALGVAVQGRAGGHGYRVGAFYQRVSDYIVGTPYSTNGVNNVLRYENTMPACTASMVLGPSGRRLAILGVLSYVRGRIWTTTAISTASPPCA